MFNTRLLSDALNAIQEFMAQTILHKGYHLVAEVSQDKEGKQDG